MACSAMMCVYGKSCKSCFFFVFFFVYYLIYLLLVIIKVCERISNKTFLFPLVTVACARDHTTSISEMHFLLHNVKITPFERNRMTLFVFFFFVFFCLFVCLLSSLFLYFLFCFVFFQ